MSVLIKGHPLGGGDGGCGGVINGAVGGLKKKMRKPHRSGLGEHACGLIFSGGNFLLLLTIAREMTRLVQHINTNC